MRWHCPPDTGFVIRALAVWGRARYFSVMEAPHSNKYLRVSGEETFCFIETWMPERGTNPRSPIFQSGSFNHCTRAPDLWCQDGQNLTFFVSGPPEDGEINEMTLPSRHMIHNSETWWSGVEHATSRSWRLHTVLNIYEWAGKKHFVSLKLECQSGGRTRDLRFSNQAASTTAPGPPTYGVKTDKT